MDLVVAMAPCVDEVTMSQTFELIRPYLEVRTRDILPAHRRDVFQTSQIILNTKRMTFKSALIYCLYNQELNNRFFFSQLVHVSLSDFFVCVE